MNKNTNLPTPQHLQINGIREGIQPSTLPTLINLPFPSFFDFSLAKYFPTGPISTNNHCLQYEAFERLN